MGERPKFERPTTPEEEHELVLERSKYLLDYIADQDERHEFEHLTGLKTRKVFERELDGALKIIRGEIREKRMHTEPLKEVSLILIDLDHFKRVNDTLGHSAGDEVLRKVSEVLIESERASDTAARFGGEELIVLMPGASVEAAVRHAEDVRSKIEQLTFDQYPGLKVTASFGVVSSESSIDAKMLLKLADEALYRAKNGGKNRVEVHTEHESLQPALE
ncbi:GGDEF domain-containing protein [Candidatus Kaiserbacteria bacterium]|nr:GGDEF domain-containing protein [Candidatus Kaiserbacteria bacterium]